MEPHPNPVRVLLYSHDSVGLGHIRRNQALAHALAAGLPQLTGRPVTGMLLTGVNALDPADLPDGFDVVVLPGVSKARSGYQPRHVQVPMADLLDMRSRMLTGAINGFRPDLVIVDRHAFGIDGELERPLRRLRATRPEATIVLGLREVLDSPSTAEAEWRRLGPMSRLRPLLDAIWVYGDPEVHDMRRTGELPGGLRDLVQFTGYLSQGRHQGQRSAAPVPPPYLLTTVGGGSDGVAICLAAASAPVPAGYRHLVVTGPQMPEEQRRRVQQAAGPHTEVVASLPDPVTVMREATAVVAMAGYNTVCELMDTEVPALLVPREQPRMEQRIRADGLSATGTFRTLATEEFSADTLVRWWQEVLGSRVDRSGVDRSGLTRVPALAAELIDNASVIDTNSATSQHPGRPEAPRPEEAPVAAV